MSQCPNLQPSSLLIRTLYKTLYNLPGRSFDRGSCDAWAVSWAKCSGHLANLVGNGPCRAHYGLLWWLTGHTNWTYSVNGSSKNST